MSATPRRVAVVLDGPQPPAWQARVLQLLRSSDALVLSSVRTVRGRRRGALTRAHAAFERHLFAVGPDALAPKPLDPRGDVPADDGGAPPLTLWLCEQPLPEDPGGGLLHLRHAGRREPVDAAFRRAVLRGAPWVQTDVVLSGSAGTRIADRTVSGVRPYSSTLSRDRALWKIAALVCRAAERAPGLGLPAEPEGQAKGAPSVGELLMRSPPRWARVVLARTLFVRPWQIRVRVRGASPTEGWREGELPVRWSEGHLYADPVLFERDGRHHLFCEDLPPGSRRAVVSHVELSRDGARDGPPQPVLSAGHHLSYPFVFAHGGEVFMIPETSAQQRVELYRADEFPRSWRHEATLLDGLIASDATVIEHGGRLWMFVCVTEPHAMMLDELHLFSAEQPRGPWRAHPLNPVVSDVRRARPAGAIQMWGSVLVRPGQDGSRRYGGAVSFNQIDELTPDAYREHEIARLEPADLGRARATHTYASDGGFEAVDLRRRRPRWRG